MASDTLAARLQTLGIDDPSSLALVLGGIAAVVVATQRFRRRAALGAYFAGKPEALSEISPWQLGVARSLRTTVRTNDDRLRPYVPRDVDDYLRDVLERERVVLVVGSKGSGVSRTGFEAAGRAFPARTRVLRPAPRTTQSADAGSTMFPEVLPLSLTLRPAVLWITDFAARFERGEVPVEALHRFLSWHRRLTVVVPMSSDDFKRLERSDNYAAFEKLMTVVTVPTLLEGRELADARDLYPSVPSAKLPRLPEYLSSHPEHVQRLDIEGASVGASIVRAALDWQRCGCAGPCHTDFLRRALVTYLPAGLRGLLADASAFEDGMAWACEPFLGTTALLEAADDEVGSWYASSALQQHLDEREADIPAATWSHVLDEVGSDPSELLAVGVTASAYGLTDVARRAWEEALHSQDDRVQREAARRLDAQLDADLESVRIVPQLLRRQRRRTLIGAITAKSPRPVTAGPRAHREGVFDPRPPTLVKRSTSRYPVRIYRLRAVRFVLRTLVLVALDTASVLLGLALAIVAKALIRHEEIEQAFDERWSLSTFSVVLAIACLLLVGAYQSDARRARLDRIALALATAAAFAAVVGAVRGEGVAQTTTAWGSFAFVLPLCFAARAWYDRKSQRWVSKHGLEPRVLLIGSHVQATDAGARLPSVTGCPIDVIGYLSDELGDNRRARLGGLRDLETVVERFFIHRVVISDTDLSADQSLLILDRCVLLGVTLDMVLSIEEMRVFDKAVPFGGTMALQRLAPLGLEPTWAAAKRTADAVASMVALIVLFPVMLGIGLAVALDSAGPVVVRSYRHGFGSRLFGMMKFRTTHEVDGVVREEDAPTTRVGRVLSYSLLDELPQLLNVVRGEMSLVGPRPLPQPKYDEMEEWHRLRYLVPPGVTGSWQLSPQVARFDYDEVARHDLIYMRTWSVWRDIEMLLRTPLVVARRIGQGCRAWIRTIGGA